jgi:hypothetical protein
MHILTTGEGHSNFILKAECLHLLNVLENDNMSGEKTIVTLPTTLDITVILLFFVENRLALSEVTLHETLM